MGRPAQSKLTNEHSAPLSVGKQAEGLKWYLRGGKKKKSRAPISRTQCQELIYLPRSLCFHTSCGSVPRSSMLGSSEAFRTASQIAGCKQHQLMEDLEACLGPLPILSSKCQTRLTECQAGSVKGEGRLDTNRQLHEAGLNDV